MINMDMFINRDELVDDRSSPVIPSIMDGRSSARFDVRERLSGTLWCMASLPILATRAARRPRPPEERRYLNE
ncbi:hypothetical protein WMF31_37840 [Sorangium sp. So ce1036]|uniref:hypothetical protein n=1 Tax=Sorangium sp. So ce1036 TaxID=3133328 RepID=UPI003F020CF3